MELEQLINEFYSGMSQKYEGVIKIKNIDTMVTTSLQRSQKGELLMVNIMAIDKTNIGMSTTYVVDITNDEKDRVVKDFETLVSFMFFGVDKVAKKVIPNN